MTLVSKLICPLIRRWKEPSLGFLIVENQPCAYSTALACLYVLELGGSFLLH